MSIENESSYGESEDYEDKPEEDHDSEQHGYQDEEGGPTCHRGKNSEGGWQTQGQLKEKGHLDGASYNCGSKSKSERKGQGRDTQSEHGYRGGCNNYNSNSGSYKRGKFVNVFPFWLKVLLKCVLTPFCASVSSSELTSAVGSEVDRAHHDGFGGRQPKAGWKYWTSLSNTVSSRIGTTRRKSGTTRCTTHDADHV